MITPVFKRLVFRVVTFVLAMTVGLLLAEGILRLYNPIVSRVRHNRIVLPRNTSTELANIVYRGLDPQSVHVKNSLGFRGAEPPPAWDNHLTLLFVGGSATESYYQREEKTWVHLAGAALADSFSNLWWNNAGLDGHSTFGHQILLADYIGGLCPDVVVFLFGSNDVGQARPKAFDAENVRRGLDTRGPKALMKSVSAYSELGAITLQLYRWNRAQTLGLHHTNLDLETVPSTPLESEPELQDLLERHRATYLDAYRKRVERLVELTREAGAIPVFITQPLLVGEGVDDRTGVDLEEVRVDLYEPGISGRSSWALLELYNDATREVAAGSNVPLVDLARRLPKTTRFFYDAAHYTNAGSAAVARIVAADLCPLLADAFPRHRR